MGGSGSSLSRKRGRRNAERRTLVTAAAYFPDRRETEAHGNASRRSVTAFFETSVRPAGDAAPLSDFAPHACPRPATSVAEPRSGPGRKPEASRVRGATLAPRPQAPHPAPHYKASQVTPLIGMGCLGIYT